MSTKGSSTPPLDSHTLVLRELKSLGFRLNPRNAHFPPVGPLMNSGGYGAVARHIENSIRERKDLTYEIDGLVIKVDQRDVREELGYTGHHPRWALAYKFESPQGETTITAIEIQVGRSGRITPVARVETRLHRRLLDF